MSPGQLVHVSEDGGEEDFFSAMALEKPKMDPWPQEGVPPPLAGNARFRCRQPLLAPTATNLPGFVTARLAQGKLSRQPHARKNHASGHIRLSFRITGYFK